MNPLDFFYWGHLDSIYARGPLPNTAALEDAIRECSTGSTHAQLMSVTAEFENRLHYTIARGGSLFEHLL